MAELFAGVGGVASLLTISKEFIRAGRKLKYYRRTLKYAKEEMEAVGDETKNCGNIILLFDTALATDESPTAVQVREQGIDQSLRNSSETLLSKITAIIKKRLRPMSKRHGQGTLQRATARWMWLFQKSEVNEILAQLERVKTSVQLCMSLVIYGALRHKASIMAVVSPELEERLEAMEKSLKRLERAWERQGNVLTESNPSQAADESRFRQMVAEMVRSEVHESEYRRREERIPRQRARQASSVSVPETGASRTAPSSSSSRPSPSTSPAPPEPPPTGPGSGPSGGREDGTGGQQGRSPVGVPFTSPIPNNLSTSPDLRYCYRCGRYHPNVEEDDRDVGNPVTHGLASNPAPAASSAGSQSDLMHEPDRPRHGEGEIPGDRRTWMRAEGPPVWEERPLGGRGTDHIDDIPPPDRPAK